VPLTRRLRLLGVRIAHLEPALPGGDPA